MRPLRLLALLALLVAPPAFAAEGFKLATKDPEPLPEVSFVDRAGNAGTLAGYKGRIVVLNLWATWCVPCREEMPALDRLQAQLGKEHVAVVGLAVDRGGAEAVDIFLGETPVREMDIVIDQTTKMARALRAPGLPTTLVLDRDGNEIARVLGLAAWDSPEAVAAIEKLTAP